MKEITTKSGKILLVKVPDECLRIQNTDFPFWYLYDNIFDTELVILYGKKGTCEERIDINYNYRDLRLLGKFSELKDEDFESMVASSIKGITDEITYRDYTFEEWEEYYSTKESFKTLVKSQGLDDNLNNYLIIKVL